MADAAQQETKTAKPGYKTTEFWLTVASQIVGVLLVSGVVAEDSPWSKVIGMAAMALSGMGYSVSRGAAKK